MALKDCSDNEAVRSGGQDLVDSPAAGRSLCQKGCVETHRGELYAEPHPQGSATGIISECPRGTRMALNDYSDNEAVRSRGQDLVST